MNNMSLQKYNRPMRDGYTGRSRGMLRDGSRRRPMRRDAAAAYFRTGTRGVMRDVTPPGPSNNVIGGGQKLSQFGWIGPAVMMMGNSARWACSLNPDNEIIAAPGNYPLETLATSPRALLNGMMIACAGSSGKTFAGGVWAGAALSLALTANTTIACGARVKITNAPTTFKFGLYEIQLAITATVISYIIVQVTSLPVDIIILAINYNAGRATIVADTAPTVVIPYSASAGAIGNLNASSLVAGDVITCETINMRDIGDIDDAVEQGTIVL